VLVPQSIAKRLLPESTNTPEGPSMLAVVDLIASPLLPQVPVPMNGYTM